MTQPLHADLEQVEAVVREVLQSRRYRHLAPRFVERIARQELRAGQRDVVKRTKRRLHQVFGAYVADLNPEKVLDRLTAAKEIGEIEATCRHLLSQHASTRERQPIVDHFYREIFAVTGYPRILLDLACGLGPVALPWMDLPDGAQYFAYDVDQRLVDIAAGCIGLWAVAGGAALADVVADPPSQAADVALLLKSVPCLEQQERGSSIRLIDAARVPVIVVSFPTRSLGGASKGMVSHYQGVMAEMAAERPWRLAELTFPSELVYIVQKTVDQ